MTKKEFVERLVSNLECEIARWPAIEKDLDALLAAERQRWAKQVDEEAQRDIDRGNPIEGAHYRALKKIGGLT